MMEDIEDLPEGSEQPDPPETDEKRLATETEAKKYGWRPKEDFDRDPDGWVDAERFMELPSTHVKVMRDESRTLKQQIEDDRKARAEDMARVEAVSKSAIDEVRKQERQRYDQEIATIQQAKRQAVETADVQRFDQLSQRERQIVAPQHDPQPQGPVPEVTAYRDANEWAKDPALWQEAALAVDYAAKSGRQLTSPKEQLEYAESVMKRKYPHMFAAPVQTQQVQRVDGGGLAGGGRRAKSADDLPSDVRKVGMEFVKEGVFKSLNDYAVKYWENA